MERFVDLKDISDGRRYRLNDMVKVGCEDCKGCSDCCRDVGNTIVLDPYDIFLLTTGLNLTFEQLLVKHLDLNVVDGMILPNLKLRENREGCTFLNDEGRCSIHPYRPGFCRMFPLGRVYEDGDFYYILQVNECKKERRTKMKVKKWIDIEDVSRNEGFINQWHFFVKETAADFINHSEEKVKAITMLILNVFYVTLYEESRDFYEQFAERMQSVKKQIKEILSDE